MCLVLERCMYARGLFAMVYHSRSAEMTVMLDSFIESHEQTRDVVPEYGVYMFVASQVLIFDFAVLHAHCGSPLLMTMNCKFSENCCMYIGFNKTTEIHSLYKAMPPLESNYSL